jgi:hypothetical protein
MMGGMRAIGSDPRGGALYTSDQESLSEILSRTSSRNGEGVKRARAARRARRARMARRARGTKQAGP